MDGIIFTILALVMLFHPLGIYLLLKETEFDSRFYLANLSMTEIFRSLFAMLFLTLKTKSILAANICVMLSHSFKTPYYYSMFILTLDRFCEIYYHLSYPGTWFYKNKMIAIMIGWICWVGHVGFLFIFSASHNFRIAVMKEAINGGNMIHLILSCILVLQFIIVYGYITVKIFVINQRSTLKFGLVPFLVVGTFVLLNFIPDVVVAIDRPYFLTYAILSITVNSLTDVMIYVFLQKQIRQRFFKLFTRYRSVAHFSTSSAIERSASTRT